MEEMDYIVTLTDEDGNDERFEFIDLLEKDGQKYAVLMPADDEESTDVVIMQMREEEERLLSVDDDDLLEALYQMFIERITQNLLDEAAENASN